MSLNLSPNELYNMIAGDFEVAWNSVARNPSAQWRGNFMFARQVMTILEFVSRLCWSDTSGSALATYSRELKSIEPRYFTKLPGFCADFDEFDLPYDNSKGDELLWALFDLIRNGQAHQYQQIIAKLSDQKQWGIMISGADSGVDLDRVRAQLQGGLLRDQFLNFSIAMNQVLWLMFRPDVAFLDLTAAARNSNILSRRLTFNYLTRPRTTRGRTKTALHSQRYAFTLQDLESRLTAGNHLRL